MIGQVVEGDVSIRLEELHQYYEPILRAIDTRSVCLSVCSVTSAFIIYKNTIVNPSRYTSVVDTVIGECLSSCDPCYQKWFQDFVALSLPSIKHHVRSCDYYSYVFCNAIVNRLSWIPV